MSWFSRDKPRPVTSYDGYFVGQRVIINNSEIGTVEKAQMTVHVRLISGFILLLVVMLAALLTQASNHSLMVRSERIIYD